jgi:hypothetical protein
MPHHKNTPLPGRQIPDRCLDHGDLLLHHQFLFRVATIHKVVFYVGSHLRIEV